MGKLDFLNNIPILFKYRTKDELNLFVRKIGEKFDNWNEKEMIELAHYLNPEKKWPFAKKEIYSEYDKKWEITNFIIIINGPTNHRIRIEEAKYKTGFIDFRCFYEVKSTNDFEFINNNKGRQVHKFFKSNLNSFRAFLELENEREKEYKEKIEIENLEKLKKREKILKGLDSDNNGVVDIIQEKIFNKILEKHQKKIIEIDRTYIQQFVKASSYIEDKKKNIQYMFKILKKIKNEKNFDTYNKILKNEIHTFNLLLINALGMITALVEDDMITFYQIHDSFDKLGVFNSNWENEVSQKLSNIGDKLDGLMFSIQDMSYKIVKEIGNLSYVTQELNNSMSKQLSQINSSINLNTLMTGIQTYQMYKINKNTKQLRG